MGSGRIESRGARPGEQLIAYFDAHGIWVWPVWYAVLWLAVLPFALLVVWSLFRVSPSTSDKESTWLNGAVIAAFVTLILSSLVSALLYARAQPDRTWLTYVLWLAVHFVCWTFLGSGVFFASLQALAPGPRVGLRRISGLLALVGVAVIHTASLYATHVFRHR
jgi:hypothetical protein